MKRIKNDAVCVVVRFVFMFCWALAICRCIAFQNFFVIQNNSKFVIYCDYDLIQILALVLYLANQNIKLVIMYESQSTKKCFKRAVKKIKQGDI